MHSARPLRSTRRLQNLAGVQHRWWKIENKTAAGGPTLVSIYDEIGMYGVSAIDFLGELRSINGDIEVHVNSPGGDVFDGIAIYNQLKQAQNKGTVHIVVDGLAASAASFICQAASPGHLEMAPHSEMMIHDGFAMGIGNAADMRELADQLDRASNNIASIYASRTGKDADHWRQMMRKETWLTAEQAVTEGLADRVQGNGTTGNTWDMSVYASWTKRVRNDSDMDEDEEDDDEIVTAPGDTQLGQGWVRGPDGKVRFDPDGDGDDDSSPETDTDHGWWDEDGNQLKPIPPKPKGAKAKGEKKLKNADVDNSPWDASKAWHNGTQADDPEAFYRGICAGEKNGGDPDTQAHWALPYRYTPSSPPNAAGVRNALARLPQTHDLKNESEARSTLEAAMKKVNPDYDNKMDSGLLSAALVQALKGGA